MQRRFTAWGLLVLVMVGGSTVFGWLLTAAIGPRPPNYGRIWGGMAGPRPVATATVVVGRQFTSFQPPQPLADYQLREFQRAIDAIGRIVVEGQIGTLALEFDAERMALEEIPLGVYDLLGQTPTPALLEASGRDIVRDIVDIGEQRPETFPQGTAQILSGSWSPDRQEALVIAKHVDPKAGTRFVRWWLRRDGSGIWRTYDFDFPNTRLRFSTVRNYLLHASVRDHVAAGSARDPNPNAPDVDAFARYQNAFDWLLLAGGPTDPAGANASVWFEPVEQVPMLPYVQAARYVARARQMALRGDANKADAAAASAAATIANAAHVRLGKAVAANAKKQWRQARDAVRLYREVVGDDPIAYLEDAKAIAGLDGPDAAIAELRKGLKVFPGDAAIAMELVRRLPADRRESFGAELAKAGKPELLATAGTLFEKQFPSILDGLSAGWLKVNPTEGLALRMATIAKLALGQPKAAGGMMKRMTEPDRRDLTNLLSGQISFAASPIDHFTALALAGVGKVAFRRFAQGTASVVLFSQPKDRRARLDSLAAIVAAHRAASADDPWLHYAAATLHEAAGAPAQADAELAAGMAKLASPKRTDRPTANEFAAIQAGDWEPFRFLRTELLFRRGKWKQAYADAPPAVDTFDQLANRLTGERDEFALAELIELHAKVHPHDLELIAWRGELSYLKKDHENAVKFFKDYRDKADKENRQYYRMNERLIRSLVRLKRPDEAKAVLDEAVAVYPVPIHSQVLVAAATGDADAVMALFDRTAILAHTPWYADPDLGPLLRGPAFDRVRQKYPPPVR